MAQTRFINPKTLSQPPGYTHVVETTGPGRIVYISGQLGLDVGGKLVGQAGDFEAQATQTFENIRLALAEVGATFKDIVKINNYLTDMKYLPIFRDVRNKYINMAAPPASTTIQISGLAREGALLETEVVVLLPPKATRAPARGTAAARPRAKKTARPAARRKAKRR